MKVVPRFATIVGLVGNEKVVVEKDCVIDGSIGARLNIDVKENSEVSGSLTSVERKVKLEKETDVAGDIDDVDRVSNRLNQFVGKLNVSKCHA